MGPAGAGRAGGGRRSGPQLPEALAARARRRLGAVLPVRRAGFRAVRASRCRGPELVLVSGASGPEAPQGSSQPWNEARDGEGRAVLDAPLRPDFKHISTDHDAKPW